MRDAEKPIRVLIVDDSPLTRDMIRAILSSAPDMAVIGEAGDGLEAVRAVAALKPDVVTMDIEMPVLGGLEAIARIMTEHPVAILVVTALTGVRTAFSAISRGALDVIEKPDVSLENMQTLQRKVRLLAGVDIGAQLAAARRRPAATAVAPKAAAPGAARAKIVAVAASTGGPQAIHSILAALPAAFPVPILITQHIAEGFTRGMVDWLAGATPLKVSVARNGEALVPGAAYVNPAEKSMRITGGGLIVLEERDPGRFYHPCCDTMLTSVAASCRERAVGVILSGMGSDGVAGLEAIRARGGTTLAQDAQSSVVYGMNRSAVERGCVDKVIPLAAIPAELMQLAGKGHGGERKC